MLMRAGTLTGSLSDRGRRRDGRFELLDPDRGRLELGRAGLGIGRIDRQEIRGDIVLEMEGHERQPWAEALLDPNRRLDGSAPGDDANPLAVREAVGDRILGRD